MTTTPLASRTQPPMVTRIAHSVVLAWGWKRALLGFAAGAATAVSRT